MKIQGKRGVYMDRGLKTVVLTLIHLVFFAAIGVYADTPTEGAMDLIKTGDEFFERRSDGHEGDWAKVEPIKKALDSYLKAYELGERSPELAVKILRATYFYGTFAEKDRAKQKEAFSKALEIGEEILKANPDYVGLNYQLAGNWGRWSEVNGIMASARMGVADKIKTFGEKLIKLDPNYAEGGGYRTMGITHFKAPYIPFILSWPSKKESLKYLKQAVSAGPENLMNHLFYAEVLYHAGFPEEALTHLDSVLLAPLNPLRVVEDLRSKKDAEALKNKILSEHKK